MDYSAYSFSYNFDSSINGLLIYMVMVITLKWHFKKIKIAYLGTRGVEKEKNSPGNAFHRITKLTGQMLETQIKRNEKQRNKIGGQGISTPISSARSTPTVHWDPTTVTGSMCHLSCKNTFERNSDHFWYQPCWTIWFELIIG